MNTLCRTAETAMRAPPSSGQARESTNSPDLGLRGSRLASAGAHYLRAVMAKQRNDASRLPGVRKERGSGLQGTLLAGSPRQPHLKKRPAGHYSRRPTTPQAVTPPVLIHAGARVGPGAKGFKGKQPRPFSSIGGRPGGKKGEELVVAISLRCAIDMPYGFSEEPAKFQQFPCNSLSCNALAMTRFCG